MHWSDYIALTLGLISALRVRPGFCSWVDIRLLLPSVHPLCSILRYHPHVLSRSLNAFTTASRCYSIRPITVCLWFCSRYIRTGVNKALFGNFYKLAKREAYAKNDFKSAWRATGIHPLNPTRFLKSPNWKRGQLKIRNNSPYRSFLHRPLGLLSYSRPLSTGGNFVSRQ